MYLRRNSVHIHIPNGLKNPLTATGVCPDYIPIDLPEPFWRVGGDCMLKQIVSAWCKNVKRL